MQRVSEGMLGPVDYHCRAPFVCVPVQEAGQQHQQLPKPAHQKQRSSNNRSSSQAAYSMSRVAGRPCGHSCQELPRAGNLCFLTRVSEGTLGLVDYHCRAPFRPSVPWCFPVREVRFLKAICSLKSTGNLCSLTRVSEGTLGLVDYHCRAPFRPSVPWCFPVREVRFY